MPPGADKLGGSSDPAEPTLRSSSRLADFGSSDVIRRLRLPECFVDFDDHRLSERLDTVQVTYLGDASIAS